MKAPGPSRKQMNHCEQISNRVFCCICEVGELPVNATAPNQRLSGKRVGRRSCLCSNKNPRCFEVLMYERPSEKRRGKDLLIPKGIFPPSPCWKLPYGSRRWVNSDVWSTVMEMPRIKKLLDAHANLTADRWDMDMEWVDVQIDMGWRD